MQFFTKEMIDGSGSREHLVCLMIGWEGFASDSRVLRDALSQRYCLEMPSNIGLRSRAIPRAHTTTTGGACWPDLLLSLGLYFFALSSPAVAKLLVAPRHHHFYQEAGATPTIT
ncbi:hypothetical protein CMV_007652 [Castanea mollissima]|uniref:Uncharacterized protein n=1 Tax=Castanea mollissima TaxID=60419 RepID=A0A8J4RUR1_9ROSI|nr:hypothetical protein CMV_007652 [Castanea mollissima]